MVAKWGTADGRKIPYSELEDSHLKNIIKDGYRNSHIEEEARKRGFKVPRRAIEDASDRDIMMYVESFASCAISGNQYAEIMIGLWRTDKAKFFFHLNALLERKKELNIE